MCSLITESLIVHLPYQIYPPVSWAFVSSALNPHDVLHPAFQTPWTHPCNGVVDSQVPAQPEFEVINCYMTEGKKIETFILKSKLRKFSDCHGSAVEWKHDITVMHTSCLWIYFICKASSSFSDLLSSWIFSLISFRHYLCQIYINYIQYHCYSMFT